MRPRSARLIPAITVFESFRQALHDVLRRGTGPEERRALLSQMRGTLAQAKVGLDDLRSAITVTRERLAVEQRELDTVARRRRLAEQIGDEETVRIAERFERQHADRVAMLARKLEAQEGELALTEGEVQEMTAAYRSASLGVPPAGAGAVGGRTLEQEAADEIERDLHGDATELNAMRRAQERSAREQDAARRLEELKRRMGK